MWNSTALLLLCLFVIAYLDRIRAEINDCLRINASGDASAYSLFKFIDKNTNPCDDFFGFTCGKYVYEKQLREYHGDINLSSEVSEMNGKYSQFLLEYHSYHRSYTDNIDKNLATILFESCLNREKQGLRPMLQLLEKYGGWPVVKGEYWHEAYWLGLIKTFLKENFHITPFLSMKYESVQSSGDDSFKGKQLLLGIPELEMDKAQLLENKDIYHELMVDVAVQFGANRRHAQAHMFDVIRLELELAGNYGKPKVNVSLTFKETELLYPNMMKYMRPLIGYYFDIDENLRIILQDVHYFTHLETTFTRMTTRTVANYLIWRAVIVAGTSELLTDELYQRFLEFNTKRFKKAYKLDPLPYLYQQKNKCFEHAKELLPTALDNIYIEHHLNFKSAKATATELFNRILEEFYEMVNTSAWMDNEAKSKTVRKLTTMKYFIGQRKLPRIRDVELLSDNFFQNVLRLKEYQSRQPKISVMPVWDVNAEYFLSENYAYILAGILQWPHFNFNAPSYFNYGGLGGSIGHEISHAIDLDGHTLDRYGTLYAWLNTTEKEYQHRANCFRRQYSEMKTEEGYKINVKKTISEDISDNLGIKATYRAYVKHNATNQKLTALCNYTDRQLFWISWAHSQCGYTSPSYYKTTNEQYDHTIPRYRVLGVIKNMPDFTKDFGCPRKSNMYSAINEVCELL